MISTKDLGGDNNAKAPKTLQPGNEVLKINSVVLEKNRFRDDSYDIILNCEGKDMGSDFEGFFVDKDNESAGRYKGQVGRIKASRYSFEDKDLDNGNKIIKEVEMSKFLRNLAIATDSLEWYEGQDGKHETIGSLIDAINESGAFDGKWLNVCICGREYESKSGYTNYDLFLPKFTKDGIPFENAETGAGKVYTFNDAEHVMRRKEKKVDSFEPETETDTFGV